MDRSVLKKSKWSVCSPPSNNVVYMIQIPATYVEGSQADSPSEWIWCKNQLVVSEDLHLRE